MSYTVWYLPDSPEGLLSEPLSATYEQHELPPYDLSEGEIVDFILNDINDAGEPLEVLRKEPFESLWKNRSWGID